MKLEQAQELRRQQGLRVANASRERRDRELTRYELLDALADEIFWREAMRQQCLRF